MTFINRRTMLTAVGAGSLASHAHASPPLTLTPSVEEGPFYLPEAPTRDAIADDRQGAPIALRIKVLDETRAPLAGAGVDVWHCDATGRYSGFEGGDDQPLRRRAERRLVSSRRADNRRRRDGGFSDCLSGMVSRAHDPCHFKIWRGGMVRLTSQMFLPDGLSEFLYTRAKTYARAQPRDTFNHTDRIAIAAGDRVAAAVSENEDYYTVALTVVVDRSAHPVADPRGAPGRSTGATSPLGPPPPGGEPGDPPPFGPPGFGPPGSGLRRSGPPVGPPPTVRYYPRRGAGSPPDTRLARRMKSFERHPPVRTQ